MRCSSICFISEAFEGAKGDKEVFLKSGIMDYLVQEDLVMADCGFTIREELNVFGVKFNISSFLMGREKLTPQEEIVTKCIARSRRRKFQNFEQKQPHIVIMVKYLFFYWSDFYKYFVKIKNGISVSFTLNMIIPVTVLIEIWQAKDHRGPVFSYSKFRTVQFEISDKMKLVVLSFKKCFDTKC